MKTAQKVKQIRATDTASTMKGATVPQNRFSVGNTSKGDEPKTAALKSPKSSWFGSNGKNSEKKKQGKNAITDFLKGLNTKVSSSGDSRKSPPVSR